MIREFLFWLASLFDPCQDVKREEAPIFEEGDLTSGLVAIAFFTCLFILIGAAIAI